MINKSFQSVIKKLLPLILTLIVFSCREKETDCFSCTTTFTIYARYGSESQTISISDTREVCDMTEDQIREYERYNSDTTVYINGDVRLDSMMVTLCTR